MKHTTIHDLGARAHVVARERPATRVLRRVRLERFAILLDAYEGQLQLLSRIEYVSRTQRDALRADDSPLTVAYSDPLLRAEGFGSDRLGDAMRFFALTTSEAHHLLCDCHYGTRSVASRLVAMRAREIAGKRSLGERWCALRDATDRAWRRLLATS